MRVDVYSAFEIGAMTILGNESRRFVDLPEYQRLEADLAKERERVKELEGAGKTLVEANTRHFNTATENYHEAVQLQEQLAKEREKVALYRKSYLLVVDDLAAEREKVKELAKDLSRVLETVKYLRGIAERGSGDRCPEDMTVEKFVLGYVKNLEQHIRNQNEQLAAAQAKVTRLEADVQRLQKLKEDYGPTMVAMQKQAWAEADRQSQINRLSEQLAAAQATIAEMREALTEVVDADECQDADGWLCFELSAEAYHRADAALAIPTNQDALHELRALECERLANVAGDEPEHVKAMFSEWLREEAAAHRAKKGEGK